jgi:oligosaccharyltransferase complex subunit delta (ribophorin II)
VLSFTFAVKSQGGRVIHPQQASLRFVHARTGASAVITALPVDKKHQAATVDVLKALPKTSGDFKVALLVGDANLDAPIAWDLGAITINFSKEDTPSPIPGAPLPAISHVFRAPEKRPPATVSLIFTAAVGASAFVLFILVREGGGCD